MRLLSPLLALVLMSSCGTPQERPDGTPAAGSGSPLPAAGAGESPALAIEWNRQVLAVAEAEDGFLSLKGLRTATMMHLAMHDALNAAAPRYRPYLDSSLADHAAMQEGADPLVAAARAAHDVAVGQYPGQAAAFDALYADSVRVVADSRARRAGAALGARMAAAILEAREGDGWNGEAEYTWHPMAPGVYAEFNEHSGTPEGFVFGAGWARAKPFVLESPDQFRSPPPPRIDSAAYTRAFDEVKAAGAHDSAVRTADQAHLAMWWKDFAENSHNRLARELARQDDLDLWQATRMFALLNMAIYDAYVNVFDNKFHYNHWRPYTAIRWASHDGNPDTAEDPAWNNLHRHTYAFPSYPSAHGTACAAASMALADTFGRQRPITMTTAAVDKAGPMSGKITMDPPTRSFASFDAAAEECALSRVYLGIHFRYDSVEGVRLGREIGNYVVLETLAPAATR